MHSVFHLLLLSSLCSSVQGVFARNHKGRLKPVQLVEKRRSSDSLDDDASPFEDPNSNLLNYIKHRARPYRRPVLHLDEITHIHVRASLYQIVDLDQRNNLATLSAYFDVRWTDPFIAWNSSDFGANVTFVPARWVWKPEFYFFHSIQGRTPEYDSEATAEVMYNGTVRMFVPITSRALCPINVKYFPYDVQNCSFNVSLYIFKLT
uniref:Neur_chan_LBD domain-containing protein n=1 Tax=Bursaphelenchus xylophilus TaxID=6326 RepID=A0A1I7S384_BURXY